MSQKTAKQAMITDIKATPIKIPEKIELTKPNTQQQKPVQNKPIPQEILTLTRGMEEIEGILYAMRQQILQQYGPINYTISDIELSFSEQQANLLSFEQQGNHWIIKPKQFLGEQMFADVLNTVRVLGGEYIPTTKDSHPYFKVPKQKAQT